MIFREANLHDIPTIMDIRLSVTENILSTPELVTPEICADYLVTSGKGWVCEVDGEVVGFSIASAKDASIWALFVRPGYEGRGIGSGLLKIATGWLFDMGAATVSLSTDANTRADSFYEYQGWKREGTKPNGEVGFSLERPKGS